MKEISFFTPEENVAPRKTSEKAEKTYTTGYITSTGKVIIPQKSAEEVGIEPQNSAFKIGKPENKRKLKSLFLVPASREEEGVFEMEESGRNFFLPLGPILEKGGLDVQNNKYTFNIKSFDYNDVTAFELKLDSPTSRTKRPGRKAKSEE
ncbi:hypothetical protein [Persicitalea sp.]|uniref:hypothetical protein n=1 Tax=Persicitalea sp. TaxID=3100273 RepID=UPI003592EC4D